MMRRRDRQTTSPRLRGTLAVAVACGLLVAACSSTSSDSGASREDVAGGAQVAVWAQPDDKGQTVLDAIKNAQTSIDIGIYEMNGPDINKALQDAIARGVNVRVILNGTLKTDPDATSPSTVLAKALEDAAGKSGAGKVTTNWSSQNFAISHWKVVIVDAADKDGNPLSAGDLPAGAQALVMTGNMSAYDWGNPKYPCEDPCVFWSARDFGMTVTDKDQVAGIESVFHSDFQCDGPTVDNGLKSDSPLTWSNGSFFPDEKGQYPNNQGAFVDDPSDWKQGDAYPFSYFDFPATQTPSPDADPGPGFDQGNVRAAMMTVIDGAKQTLRVYNEELKDQETIVALTDAAKRGIDVKLVMMAGNIETKDVQSIVDAGGAFALYDQSKDAALPYIHAKMFVADGDTGDANAYVGSTNASSQSMNYNRELGLTLDGKDQLATFVQTFDTDFNRQSPGVAIWDKDHPNPPSTAQTADGGPGPQPLPTLDELRDWAKPQTCGAFTATG